MEMQGWSWWGSGEGREGKTEEETEEETKGGTEEKGRGYGREDFEVAHDLERCNW